MEQDKQNSTVREVLGDDYRSYEVTRYTLTEDMGEGQASLVAQLHRVGDGVGSAVEGEGVGMVDALFQGLKRALAPEYPSLEHIHFVDFRVIGDFSSTGNQAHSDAPGLVELAVENSEGRRFTFESKSTSVSASAVGVVVRAVEHFVNAELAVLRLYEWIQDAKRRTRPDLAERYTNRLAELVKNASYSESIERRRKQLEES